MRTPRKTLVIFCEGQRTEPEYLHALKLEPQVRDIAAVDLKVESTRNGARPIDLVDRAIDARQRAIDEEGEVDEFWCVFDVEWPQNHPTVREAVASAQANQIYVAVSNPCFELWLIIHFIDHTAWLTTDEAIELRSKQDGSKDKGLDTKRYMPRREDAVRRAIALTRLHARNDATFPEDNPSSGMHLLLASLSTTTEDE